MRVAGVDGTKKGWVAVVLKIAEDLLISPIDSPFTELHDVQVVAIDVPRRLWPACGRC